MKAIIVAGITGIIGVIFCLPDFSISVESLQGSVEQGGSIETRIIVKNKSIIPYKGEVRLNYTEHPSDIFITFDPQTKKPDYNSTMRIQTGVNTQVGSYTIKIKGNGSDEKEHNISYVLIVQCSEEIIITDPPQNYTIPITYTVQGTITTSEPNPNIWVIVHPTQTNKFWVEPEANFSDQQHETTWRALIYIGEEEAGVGEQFEIMAVVNPTQTLIKGMILDNWPEAQKSSEIIRVTRE